MMRMRVGALAGLTLFVAAAPVAAQSVVLPEVVVTAPSPILSPRIIVPVPAPSLGSPPIVEDSFVPVTVLRGEEIRASGARTIGEAIGNQPGITSSSFAPGAASRPIIRGLDNFRVRIQENGVGVQDVSELGEDHGVPIDPLAADRIEVIRGPATLRYGSTAIGGVVSVINNRIPTALGQPGASATITTSLSSADRGRDGAAVIDASHGNVAIHGDFFGRRTEDYMTPLGRQANSYLRSNGQSVGASMFFDGGFVGASLSRFAAIYGVPGVESSARRTQIDMEQTRFQARGEYRPTGGPLDAFRFWLGGSDYRHNENALEDELFGTHSTFRNREIEGRLESQFASIATPIGTLHSAFGVQVGRQRLGAEGEALGLLAPATTETAAAYLFGELSVGGGLRFQAAGRVDHARVAGTATTFPEDLLGASGEPVENGLTRRFAPLSASFGVLQDLPFGVVASLTGQYAERAPRAAELFSRGPHDATATFEIGDPNLRIETARSIEIGLRRARGAFRFEATAFYTRFDGFIFRRLTGNTCDDDFASCGTGAELTQVVYAQRDATFRGFELRAQQDIAEIVGGTFGIEGRYDMVRATFADGTNVPRIPPQRVGGGLYWREANWLARIDLLHAFAQRRLAELETETPAYTLLSAELRYSATLRDGPVATTLTAGIVGTNLLDEVVRNHVSFNKDEVVQPGRGVRAYLTIRF